MKNTEEKLSINKKVLKELINSKELTQKSFAEQINVAQVTVTRWLKEDDNENYKFRENEYKKIKDFFDVTEDQLNGKKPIETSSEVSINLSENQKMQFKVVQEKYGVTFENIIEAAPLLFMDAANKSLKDQKELINESIVSLNAGSNEIIDNILWETLGSEGSNEINYGEIEEKIKEIIDRYPYKSKNKDKKQIRREKIKLFQIVKEVITHQIRDYQSPYMDVKKPKDDIKALKQNFILENSRRNISYRLVSELINELDRVNSNKVFSNIGLSPSLDFRKYLSKINKDINIDIYKKDLGISLYNWAYMDISRKVSDVLLDTNSYLKSKGPNPLFNYYELWVDSLINKKIQINYDLTKDYIWKEICLEDRNVYDLFHSRGFDNEYYHFFKSTVSKEFYQQFPFDVLPKILIEKLPESFFKQENKLKNYLHLKELSEFKRFDNFGIFHRYENHLLGGTIPSKTGHQICESDDNQTNSYPFPKWAEICRTVVTANLEGEIRWFKSEDNGHSWQRLDEGYYQYIGFAKDEMGLTSWSLLETGCFAKITDILKLEYVENNKKVEIIFDENADIHKKSREVITEIQCFLRDLNLFNKGEIDSKKIKKDFGTDIIKIEKLLKDMDDKQSLNDGWDIGIYHLPDFFVKYWRDKIVNILGDDYLSNLKKGTDSLGKDNFSLIGNTIINFNQNK